MGPIRKMFVFLLVLVALLLALPYLLPLDLMFTDDLQKALSAKLKRPVSISHLSFDYKPYPTIMLENVQLGAAAKDGQISRVEIQPDLLTAFSSLKRVHGCIIDDATFTVAFLRELPDLLKAEASDTGYRLKLIHVHKGTLVAANRKSYGPLEAELTLNADQSFAEVTVSNQQHSLDATITPAGDHFNVDITGRNWQAPIPSATQFDELGVEGQTNGQSLIVHSIRGIAFGGHFSGSGTVDWSNDWKVTGSIDLDGIDGEAFTNIFSPKTNLTGRISGNLHIEASSTEVETLRTAPTVSAQITSTDGELRGFDFVQALHRNAGSSDAIVGGSTKYDQLTGNLKIEAAHMSVSNMRLASGTLEVTANASVNSGKLVGSAHVALGKGTAMASESMRLGGTFDEPKLFPSGRGGDGPSSVVQITTTYH